MSPHQTRGPEYVMAKYSIVLRCMQAGASFHGSPGALNDFELAVDEQLHGVFLSDEDGEPQFKAEADAETQGMDAPESALAIFHSLENSLMVEPLVKNVSVESLPSLDLPNNSPWSRVSVPASTRNSNGERRIIYLRPGDTVVFAEQSCKVRVIARNLERPIVTETGDVQVKSSVAEHEAGASAAASDEDTDDEDDLDGAVQNGMHTPDAEEAELTPATSRPSEGAVAVKDTPSRPPNDDENPPFSTAPDRPRSSHIQSSAPEPDMSTPAARAAESQEKRKRPQRARSEELGESQYVFKEQTRNQKTYGKRSKQSSPKVPEAAESPQKPTAAPPKETPPNPDRSSPAYDQSSEPLDEAGAAMEAASRSSHRSTRPSLSHRDDEDYQAAVSSTSGNKRKREADDEEDMPIGEPDEKQQFSQRKGPPKKARKGRGGKSKATKAQEEEDPEESSHPPSSGKLKKIFHDPEDLEDDIHAKPRSTHRTSSPHVRVSSPTAALSHPSSSAPFARSPTPNKPPTKLLLSASSHSSNKKTISWLKTQGVTIEDKVLSKRTNFVCVVGSGPLHTTVKLLRSLALNKPIVTDAWLAHSISSDRFLPLDTYLHADVTRDVNRKGLFSGYVLYFTMSLQQSYKLAFKDVKEVALETGAARVEYGSSAKKAAEIGSKEADDVIFLGMEKDDPIAGELVEEFGKVVYTRELLTQSLIRGELLLESQGLKVRKGKAGGRRRAG